jgi:signal transduction histidine kinase/DNA-binding response OmpR family regulator
MAKPRERVLIVEQDPDVSDLVSRQTLQPLGFRVKVVDTAGQAIQEALTFSPDVIIVNLNLPGLSGKDMLAALASQGVDVPVIVLAEKGMEGDVIQAFRLGATDYLRYPVREAEVVSAVERVLQQVRAKRERETLAHQLHQANQELQRRIRELTTILALGKAVTSITNQRELLDKVIEGAVFVSEADSGWLLLREDRTKSYILSAGRNLPKSVMDKINQPWDDGISSLVALSGETLAISGEPLKRFKVARMGQSALVVPIKARKEVVGLVVVVRKTPAPFGTSNQALVEAVADYASISLMNAHLFNALEARARSLQQVAESAQVSERVKDDLLCKVNQELLPPLRVVKDGLVHLENNAANLRESQREQIRYSHDSLNLIMESVEALTGIQPGDSLRQAVSVFDLNEMARQAMSRLQRIAHHEGVGLLVEMASRPVQVRGNLSQMFRVFESLLSNAIKYNKAGGQVVLRVEVLRDGSSRMAHVLIKDDGKGIEAKNLPLVFTREQCGRQEKASRFGGVGISLSLVKEIITAHNGNIWVESEPAAGTTFRFTLPIQEE